MDKATCNKENGSFSQLWGRDCWVADSVLSLIESEADRLYERNVDNPGVDAVLKRIESYARELREKNKEHWYDELHLGGVNANE